MIRRIDFDLGAPMYCAPLGLFNSILLYHPQGVALGYHICPRWGLGFALSLTRMPQRGDMFGFGAIGGLPVLPYVTPGGVKRIKANCRTINMSLLAELVGKILIHESNQLFGITPVTSSRSRKYWLALAKRSPHGHSIY